MACLPSSDEWKYTSSPQDGESEWITRGGKKKGRLGVGRRFEIESFHMVTVDVSNYNFRMCLEMAFIVREISNARKKRKEKNSSMQTASQKHDSPKTAVEQCSRYHQHK